MNTETIETKPEYKKRKYTKRTVPKKKTSPLHVEHSSLTFLFFTIGDDEYTEVVDLDKANRRAQEIFADPDYSGLQQIYFMKPMKLFNRPVMEVIEL